MLESFDETYAQYKELFEKIDEADSIKGKNELFRQLTALLSKMEHGIQGMNSVRDAKVHARDGARWM